MCMHSISGDVLGFTSKLLKDLQLQPQQVFPVIQSSVTCAKSSHSVLEQGKCQSLSKFPAGMGPAERQLPHSSAENTIAGMSAWEKSLKNFKKKSYTLTILLS